VKSKFGLEGEQEIEFEDEQGAEIDVEVFPILIEQPIIPNVVFHLKGEVQITINPPNCNTGTSQVIYGKLNFDLISSPTGFTYIN